MIRVNGEAIRRYTGSRMRDYADLPAEASYGRISAGQDREQQPLHAWYSVPIPSSAIVAGKPFQVEVEVEGGRGDRPCVTVFGDDPTDDGLYDGPSIFSPQVQADTSLYKYLIDGDFRMRRRIQLRAAGHSTEHA